MREHYKFFSHTQCEHFPCHTGVAKEDFNCLFCFCPLYAQGERCGGNFSFVNGIKDCSKCTFPHVRQNYGAVIEKIRSEREKS